MARGHKIDNVPEVPLVVSNAAESLNQTKKAIALLKQIGALADVKKSKDSKNLHKGKGKMRNRRYTMRRGPLVIFDKDNGITKAFRNIPGVEVQNVERLNLLQLAPGGHLGRFCIWTKAAFQKLDAVFGTNTTDSKQKSGFKVPRNIMTNSDLNRIINSDEIQSHKGLKAPNTTANKRAPLKKNALKNLGAMLKLNPYAKARSGARRPPFLRACGWAGRGCAGEMSVMLQFPYWTEGALWKHRIATENKSYCETSVAAALSAAASVCAVQPELPPAAPPQPQSGTGLCLCTLARDLTAGCRPPFPSFPSAQTATRIQILVDKRRVEAKKDKKAAKKAPQSKEAKVRAARAAPALAVRERVADLIEG